MGDELVGCSFQVDEDLGEALLRHSKPSSTQPEVTEVSWTSLETTAAAERRRAAAGSCRGASGERPTSGLAG